MYIVMRDTEIVSIFRKKKNATHYLRRKGRRGIGYRIEHYSWYSTIRFFDWLYDKYRNAHNRKYNRRLAKWNKLDRQLRNDRLIEARTNDNG